MKTMKKGDNNPVRVSDSKAEGLIKVGYKYCPKSEFKELKRTKK